MDDGRHVHVDVHALFLEDILVDDVVGQHCEPPLARHARRRGDDQHELIFVVENLFSKRTIPRLDALLKGRHGMQQLLIHAEVSRSWFLLTISDAPAVRAEGDGGQATGGVTSRARIEDSAAVSSS